MKTIELYVDGNTHAYACLLVARNADGSIAKRRMLGDLLNDDWTPTQATWHGAQVALDVLKAGGHDGDVAVFTRLKSLVNAGSGKVSWHYLVGIQNEFQEAVFQEAHRLMQVCLASELVETGEFSLGDYLNPVGS